MTGSESLILLPINKPLRLSGWPLCIVKTKLTANALNEPQLVITVQNLKVLGQSRFGPVRL